MDVALECERVQQRVRVVLIDGLTLDDDLRLAQHRQRVRAVESRILRVPRRELQVRPELEVVESPDVEGRRVVRVELGLIALCERGLLLLLECESTIHLADGGREDAMRQPAEAERGEEAREEEVHRL